MKKMFKNLLLCVMFLLMAPSASVLADEAISLINKQELEDMIAAIAAPQAVSVYTEWNERNPFDTSVIDAKPGDTSKAGVPKELSEKDFVVQGVFLGSAKPSAIINNMVVAVGDKIKTAAVLRIEQDRITLQDDKGKEIILNRMK